MNLEEIKQIEKDEYIKRDKELCLIASENYPSEDILNASGSIFQLKYSEGFPYKRYYQGTINIDKMESKCIEACLKLFNADENYMANVQPNSGASANMIVYNAILQPNDCVLAMDVKAGGHISHSHPLSFLSKYHNVVTYGVKDDGYLDYDKIEELAIVHKPKLIVCGASNYSRIIDFKRFKEIADKVGALLMADIAHISLLCAKGEHPTPIGVADFITFTTHKMLAGPRGGCIIYRKEFDKQIKLSTIPSLFGGPLEHQIYAKLICFNEQIGQNGQEYSKRIIKNANAMCDIFMTRGIPVITGGTDNHLCTIDLTNFSISGKQCADLLEECGVITNCNTVPNDKRSFIETSGVRFGVPAITKRGFMISDIILLFDNISALIGLYNNNKTPDELTLSLKKNELKQVVEFLTQKYPLEKIYPSMYKKFSIREDKIKEIMNLSQELQLYK